MIAMEDNEVLVPHVEANNIDFFRQERELALDFLVKFNDFLVGLVEFEHIEVFLVIVTEKNARLASYAFDRLVHLSEVNVDLQETILGIELETLEGTGILALVFRVVLDFGVVIDDFLLLIRVVGEGDYLPVGRTILHSSLF
jgi:hypothetical protein